MNFIYFVNVYFFFRILLYFFFNCCYINKQTLNIFKYARLFFAFVSLYNNYILLLETCTYCREKRMMNKMNE